MGRAGTGMASRTRDPSCTVGQGFYLSLSTLLPSSDLDVQIYSSTLACAGEETELSRPGRRVCDEAISKACRTRTSSAMVMFWGAAPHGSSIKLSVQSPPDPMTWLGGARR